MSLLCLTCKQVLWECYMEKGTNMCKKCYIEKETLKRKNNIGSLTAVNLQFNQQFELLQTRTTNIQNEIKKVGEDVNRVGENVIETNLKLETAMDNGERSIKELVEKIEQIELNNSQKLLEMENKFKMLVNYVESGKLMGGNQRQLR